MELFQPVVEQTDWHFNFSALMIPGFADGERALLQEWAHGFEDREGKFVREFQTTFNSSFWELYLFAVFKQFGFTCDFSVAAPDFVVSGPNAPFVAEAVIAGHPDGYKPEWERTVDDAQSFDRELVLQLATTRIANAIWTKYQKYLNSYSKLPHVAGRPYVICVAPFEQPLFFVQNDNALRRVLYGIDQPLWVDSETGRIPVGQALSSTVTKDNGSVIDIGFFCSDRMSEVSAVIFSNTATFTKLRALSPAGAFPVMIQAIRFNASGTEPRHVVAPRPEYQETLVDGLHVCLNPYASRPLDVSAFCNGDACIHSFDLVSREYIVHTPDGFLFQHGAIALPEAGMFEFPEQTNADASYRLPAEPDWGDGGLHPVEGNVLSFKDNHFAYYRDWTVVVARCSIDNDWNALAAPGCYRGLFEFQRADKGESCLIGADWHSTKEKAFQQMKAEIDQLLADAP